MQPPFSIPLTIVLAADPQSINLSTWQETRDYHYTAFSAEITVDPSIEYCKVVKNAVATKIDFCSDWLFLSAWGSHVPISNRRCVVQDLLAFFRSRSTIASLIKDQNSNVRRSCGYDTNLAGWRFLADTISFLPHIHSFGYRLRATDMDRATIEQIADALIASRRKIGVIKLTSAPASQDS
ncbi:hypothetical protein GGD63_006294 [Bradyrhizobium sp. cir1]|uniref:hypothetical protein n=1 Tax=Bradyrhizobium sp. cir1 TaxID=1445730 RepID=UPI0016069502|nr:hypothetical protein [Bradyrhizobium sp. cir1]MBB4373471.1 hypothetical protein [Bradyrhizobium sp. cir1]